MFLSAYHTEALVLCHTETVTTDVMKHGTALESRELSNYALFFMKLQSDTTYPLCSQSKTKKMQPFPIYLYL